MNPTLVVLQGEVRAVASASDIANYFLSIADSDEEVLSQLKLQKLLYYAQGFHLAIVGRPLFDENFLRWEHGPVVREVWDIYSKHGSSPLPVEAPACDLPLETRDVLDDVWRVYGQFSAWRLREMSHETPPWKDARPNAVITKTAMREFFETQLTAS